jgi:hypothetical protein
LEVESKGKAELLRVKKKLEADINVRTRHIPENLLLRILKLPSITRIRPTQMLKRTSKGTKSRSGSCRCKLRRQVSMKLFYHDHVHERYINAIVGAATA